MQRQVFLYEVLLSESMDTVIEVESFDNPNETLQAFECLRHRFGPHAISLKRDHCPINERQLMADVESFHPKATSKIGKQQPSIRGPKRKGLTLVS